MKDADAALGHNPNLEKYTDESPLQQLLASYYTPQTLAAAGQANLAKQQQELERKAAELERKEQELQSRSTTTAASSGGELLRTIH